MIWVCNLVCPCLSVSGTVAVKRSTPQHPQWQLGLLLPFMYVVCPFLWLTQEFNECKSIALMLQYRYQKVWHIHVSRRHHNSGDSSPTLCCNCPCWGCHRGAGPNRPCTDFSPVSFLGRCCTASIITWVPFWNCRAAASASNPPGEQCLHCLSSCAVQSLCNVSERMVAFGCAQDLQITISLCVVCFSAWL